jgi:hypothetical protein
MDLSRSCAAVRTILRLVGDVVRFVSEATRSHAQLAAENLFLRKQLALYVERQVKPRRADNATRITLVAHRLVAIGSATATVSSPNRCSAACTTNIVLSRWPHDPTSEHVDRFCGAQAWAELPEARSGDPNMSLKLLAALHCRWAAFLRGLPDEAFQRAYKHPVSGPTSLEVALASYVWHCRHHAAHIKKAIAASVTGPTGA